MGIIRMKYGQEQDLQAEWHPPCFKSLQWHIGDWSCDFVHTQSSQHGSINVVEDLE